MRRVWETQGPVQRASLTWSFRDQGSPSSVDCEQASRIILSRG